MDVLLFLFVSTFACVLPTDGPAWIASPPGMNLAVVRERPERYLGQEIQLTLQVKEQRFNWEGYTTRFQPSTYLALVVWDGDQLLWNPSEHANDFQHLFISKQASCSRRFESLNPHQSIRVNCVVREHLLGQPWLEVTRILRLKQHTPKGSVLHAIRAAKCMERNALRLAQGELERALSAPLPSRPQKVLERTLRALRRVRERLAHGWRPKEDDLDQYRTELLDLLNGA